MYLCSQKRHPFPQSRAAQLCGDLYPLFHHAVVNWLGCKEEQVRSAACHSWGHSGGVHVSGSVCAPWGQAEGSGEGKGSGGKAPERGACWHCAWGWGLPGEKQPSPVAFLQEGLGYQPGETLALLWSPSPMGQKGKGTPPSGKGRLVSRAC